MDMLPEIGVASAWGQDMTGRVRPLSSDAPTAASIPDFSGIWAHPSFPGFEPPASGPGPVMNKSRSAQDRKRQERQRPVGWRLHQSDLEAPGGGSRQEARRNRVERVGGSDPEQPVLARTPSLYFFELRHADAPTAGQDHDPLPARSSISSGAHEPVSSGADDAVLVWGFRGPLRGQHIGDRHRWDQEPTGRLPWSMGSARRTPRLCTWWNVIGYLITKPRKKR